MDRSWKEEYALENFFPSPQICMSSSKLICITNYP